MHVIPDLQRLEEKYGDVLVVIGVHSAKFNREGETEALKKAVLRNKLRHAVVNDRDFAIWKMFDVHAWPTLVLIDPEGMIVGQVAGEGHYDMLDMAISHTLSKFRVAGRPAKVRLQREKDSFLSFPGKVDTDSKLIAISDSGHNRIIVSDTKGRVSYVIGEGKPGLKDGKFETCQFNFPQGVRFHNGKVYVADTRNHALREIDLADRTVKTIAGDGVQGYSRKSGDALKISQSSPWDIVFKGKYCFIAMAGMHQIWVLEGTQIRPFAGNGVEDIRDGAHEDSCFAQPSGLWIDGSLLYVADSESSAIRAIDLDRGLVYTLVGAGLFEFGDRDGECQEARLQHPLSVFTSGGIVYIADTYNNKIKSLDLESRAVQTFCEGFNEPSGMALFGDDILVADTNNHRIATVNIKSKKVSSLDLSQK